jgi:hypothetical protein
VGDVRYLNLIFAVLVVSPSFGCLPVVAEEREHRSAYAIACHSNCASLYSHAPCRALCSGSSPRLSNDFGCFEGVAPAAHCNLDDLPQILLGRGDVREANQACIAPTLFFVIVHFIVRLRHTTEKTRDEETFPRPTAPRHPGSQGEVCHGSYARGRKVRQEQWVERARKMKAASSGKRGIRC